MNYLRQKIENANGEIAILEDNLQLLFEMPEHHQRILHVADRINFIVRHLEIKHEPYEDE